MIKMNVNYDGLSTGIGDLKQFIIDNNIVGTSAGVCIALAAKDGIQSLVGDIIIPTMVTVLKALHIDFLTKYLPVKGKTELNITDFVTQMITFILIIVISFIFVKFAFGYLLGVSYTKNGPSSAAAAAAAAASGGKTEEGIKTGAKKETFGTMYGMY
jgi:large-conductance mechanosensitive channel